MAAHADATPSARVDECISRVLTAEQVARATVEACAAEAADIRTQAQQRARAIAERAAERVARVHRWADRTIRSRTEQLTAERALVQQTEPPDPAEPARLAHALDRLAAELTGAQP
jgi:hypothetical protein